MPPPRPLTPALAVLLLLCVRHAEARVVRWEVLSTEPAFAGQSFGDIGAYERIRARAHGEVDPAAPGNAVVQDLHLAPRNARGAVEYAADVEILRPAESSRGNGVLLFEVPNRGNKLALGFFHTGVPVAAAERNALREPGDGFLMREGYTLVWTGWQSDLLPGADRLHLQAPVARNPDGASLTGIVRAELTLPPGAGSPTTTLPTGAGWLTGLIHRGYATASTDNRTPFPDGFLPTLTVRAHEQDPRVPIPNDQWSFGACPGGGPAVPDERQICLPAGFQPGRLYELIYRAKDPAVMGLGFAATRDVATFLRHERQDGAGTPNPIHREGARAVVEGSSQSGRMIRSLLQLGFNRDEDGRRVFDGAFPHIGGGLMPLNVRFAQPGRAWGHQVDHLYPAYEFPFTYARQYDPLTGRQAGLLDRCAATATCPRIFHVATVLEVWEGRQSLGLTDPLGRLDVRDPADVRTYILAGTQHSPPPLPLPAQPPFGNCAFQPNPNPQAWTLRALLRAFTAWVRDDAAPPPSTVPRIADGTLVAPDQVRLPRVPAVSYGGTPHPALPVLPVHNPLHVLDFGPLFDAASTSGVITREPPGQSPAAYGVLVPQVDADGNDLGGVRNLFLRVPIGTYTGWNLGRAGRFEGGMCNLQGGFIPFAPTRAEREAAGDPRPSLEERYPTRDAYAARVRAAADRLVAERMLLPEDARGLVEEAERAGVRAGP